MMTRLLPIMILMSFACGPGAAFADTKEVISWKATAKTDLDQMALREKDCRSHPEDEREIMECSLVAVEKSLVEGAFAPPPQFEDAKKVRTAGGPLKVKPDAYCDCMIPKLRDYLQSIEGTKDDEAVAKMGQDPITRARLQVECAAKSL